MSVGKAEGCGREVHTVTVIKDDRGYGMTVSGNDPVQVQSVVRGGAAWRAGVRKGDLILVVNGNAVESEGHAHVVELIKASPTVVLKLHRNSTITAPLPVCREKQLQVDHNKVLTIHLMLESEIRFIESLRNALAKNPSDRKQAELEAAEMRRAKLQQQLYMQTSPTSSHPNEALLHGPPQPITETPPRHGFLSNLPRSLSSLTGQSLRGIRANNNNNNHAQASPVTCLDGSAGSATLPPPLPPRSTGPPVPPPPPPPISSSAATTANHHNSHNHRHHHTAPNSIAVQMAYPLVTGTPPLIQNAAPGHHRSKSSPEELNEINNANDEKEWELVGSPPGTPPPPYPSSPAPPVILDTQRAIISMEEDDMSPTLPRNSFSSGGFTCVDTLSIARLAVFLNWVAGERRPAQAVLLYLLSDAYSKGPSTVLPRWAYELHSAFLVPEAPLSLKNVDENLAREIDDALIKDHDKEDVLRKIFLKAREKAKEEMTQQLHEFQVKRQLGLGAFYGPSDSVLNQCDLDKTQELDVIMKYLIPNLNTWIDHSSMDPWGATKGSPSNSLLAAAVPALLQYTFCLKPQLVNSAIIGSPPGSPPRPAFLQRDKLFKQRMKHLNKSSNHPLMIRGHHLSPITVTSVCHCHHCHFVIWGIAPQAYNCSDCKLRVHRSCARSVEEPCCGPTAPPTRISRLMEKLGSVPTSQIPLGNSHQHIDSNQHHHPHEKKQKKSSASSHFLNIDRGTRKGDEDSPSVLDTSVTSHNTSDKAENSPDVPDQETVLPNIIVQEEVDDEKRDYFEQNDALSMVHVLTDSECVPNLKKKNKPKHRKTMSMSSTIELVKCLGEDWIEAAKREIDEHSKKKEFVKKKEKEHLGNNKLVKEKIICDKMKSECIDNDKSVTLVLYDAIVGETDDFEVIDEHEVKKSSKKKEQRENAKNRKISAVSMMNAQKNTVKMLAKASSVTALNFIRSKRKHLALLEPTDDSYVDHTILSCELLLEHERAHTNIVQDPKVVGPVRKCDKKEIDKDAKIIKKLKKESEKAAKTIAAKDKIILNDVKKDSVERHVKHSSGEEDEEIFYDARSGNEDTPVEDTVDKIEQTKVSKPVKPKRSSGASLKRVGGGRRRMRKRSSMDDIAPPLPPKPQQSAAILNPKQTNNHQKHAHWLFGNSVKGDNKRDDDTGAESVSQLTDSSHFSSEHSAERADSSCQSRSGIAIRPVTRAESYRDRADRVKRTKRKTSDPNQLTSNREYHDVEVLGAVGGSAVPSGGSSNSSLSSKSNESAQADHGSGSEWSDEEDSSAPWSSRAPPELLANMSNLARKRQDLIHELICSEWSHVRWLRVLRRVYLIPLQKAGSTLLTPQELRALLPNLPDVLTRHKALAKELRTLQQSPKVFTGPVADALISMLGESKYAATLSRFCGGQGLALDALKEKRKRNKDLNAFLAKCEQDPMCARLRLQDLLACVWQRLTKYQLLLEGIHKSAGVIEEEVDNNPDGTQCEDFNKISVALDMAKDVLNRVNTAIQTTENEHRLRTIQGKLEFRLGEMPDSGVELKRLDLAKHSLVMEGTLSIRQDSSKKVNVLALLMRECLVLLHTDGDRHILKPIAQSAHQPLSPVIYWDKVIYRNNAAVKNGFFLVNFDGVLYEFSALSTVEYNTWAKHLMEYGRGLSGGVKNVISDEASAAMIPSTPPTKLLSPDSVPNGTPEPEPVTSNEPKPESKPVENPDDGNKVNGAAVSLVSEDEAGISGMEPKMDSSLVEPGVLTINEPPSTMLATIELTPEEKIRRAEKKISTAMIAVSEATKDISGNKPLLKTALNTLVSQDMEKLSTDSTQSLLLQAQDHVNKLTEVLLKALRVPITECSSTKCRISFSDGLCDTCSARYAKFLGNSESVARNHKVERQKSWKEDKKESENNMESIVLLEEVGESSTDPTSESEIEVVDSSGAGLRSILSELMIRLSNEEAERSVLRAKLQKADERIHYLHQLHKDCQHSGEESTRSGQPEGKPSSSNDTSSGPG